MNLTGRRFHHHAHAATTDYHIFQDLSTGDWFRRRHETMSLINDVVHPFYDDISGCVQMCDCVCRNGSMARSIVRLRVTSQHEPCTAMTSRRRLVNCLRRAERQTCALLVHASSVDETTHGDDHREAK